MNKLFRLVSVFAIAGATFAYTGCTDYSEDINEVDKRIENLENANLDNRLKDVEGSVASLKTSVQNVEAAQAKADAAITALQSALGELQDKHDKDVAQLKKDYAAADASLKAEIQGKIDALAATHAADVKAVNAAIDALKADVKTLQAKAAEVEAVIPTLATKKEVEAVANAVAAEIAKINTAIGALQGDLEVAQNNITALQTRMDAAEGDIAALKEAVAKAQKAADDAQTAADKAQADATTALGNIAALKSALGVYAEQGALEAKIAALEAIDSTLQADKFDTKDFGAYFAAELKNVIGAYAEKGALEAKIAALDAKDADLQAQIVALDKKVDEAVKALEAKIAELDKKVEAYNAALNARINAVLGIIENRLSSIAFVPQYYYDGVPAILFETIAYNPLKDNDENDAPAIKKGFGDKENSIDANLYTNFTSAVAEAKYRLNPRTVGADCADFSFVGDKADYIFTRAKAPAAPISIVGEPVYDAATGYVTFSVKKDEKLNVTNNENKNLDIVALKAVLKKGLTDDEAKADAKPEVYSEYAHVNEIAYAAAQLAISDKAKLAAKKADHEYAKTFEDAKKEGHRYEIPYTEVFDLKALVATCFTNKITTEGLEASKDHEALDLAKYDFKYSFSVAKSKYEIASSATKTDQQTVIECIDAEKGLFKTIDAQGFENNKEAIGRTPIVRVDLKHGNNIVARAFIKVIITVKKDFANINVDDNTKNEVLKCPETKVSMVYDEEKLRENVYRVLNINHVAFWDLYEFDKAYVESSNGVKTITAPELVEGVASDGKATKKVVWNFTHGEVGKIGKGTKVTGYLVLKNKLDAYSVYPSNVTFKFTVNFTLPEVKTTIEINDIFWNEGILQANVNRPESTTDVAENCYFLTPIGSQPWKVLSAEGFPCEENLNFRIAKVNDNGNPVKATSDTFKGVSLVVNKGELCIALDKSNAGVKAALNSEKGLQAVIEWFATVESGDEYVLHTFIVNFVRPVNLNLPANLSVKDAVDGGDEITFGYAGLLTDWRGEVILPPTKMEVLEEGYYWNKVCSPADHAVVFPGYTKVVKEGWYEVEYEDVEVVIPAGGSYYKASIKLWKEPTIYAKYKEVDKSDKEVRIWMAADYPSTSWKWESDGEVVAFGRTKAEAISNAEAEVDKKSEHYLDGYITCGLEASKAEVEFVVNSTKFSFKTVKKVTYHQADLVQVEPSIGYSDCNEQPVPSMTDVYTVGQRIGCWEWQKWSKFNTVPVAGQYWDFYGKFEDIVLDVKNVTTDLADKKLPSGASLVQVGMKLKYENVLSPIQYGYNIFIPASINYGWGTLNSTLTIHVNPVSTIK